MTNTLAGKCFCGAVAYAVADEFRYAMNCHCSNCRRTMGSAFRRFAGIEAASSRPPGARMQLPIDGDDKANNIMPPSGSPLYPAVPPRAFVHSPRALPVDDPAIRLSRIPRSVEVAWSPSPTSCRNMQSM